MPLSPADPAAFRRSNAATEPDAAEAPFIGLLPGLLLVAGLVGTMAAFALTVEKVALLTDSSYVPSCSLNPVLNCGSVMRTPQAEVFGFPNALLGLIGFPVVAATGAAMLVGGARLGRWYWLGLQTGATFGVGFVGWLVFQSLYRIGALCPYCMVVWAVTIAIFWYVTLASLAAGHLGAGAKSSRAVAWMTSNHAVSLTVVLAGVVTLITQRFWDYWTSLVK